ncbi:hypothetical protein VTG60DRAFT_7140 [Thermothelomyces hinnuleus]
MRRSWIAQKPATLSLVGPNQPGPTTGSTSGPVTAGYDVDSCRLGKNCADGGPAPSALSLKSLVCTQYNPYLGDAADRSVCSWAANKPISRPCPVSPDRMGPKRLSLWSWECRVIVHGLLVYTYVCMGEGGGPCSNPRLLNPVISSSFHSPILPHTPPYIYFSILDHTRSVLCCAVYGQAHTHTHTLACSLGSVRLPPRHILISFVFYVITACAVSFRRPHPRRVLPSPKPPGV